MLDEDCGGLRAKSGRLHASAFTQKARQVSFVIAWRDNAVVHNGNSMGRQYSALTSNAELIDWLFRPLLARRLREELVGKGQAANGQGIDPAHEHFARCVSAWMPASRKYSPEALIGAGNPREASDCLQALDEGYGGLATPRSIELERSL